MNTTMTDDWRRQVEREALDQGIPPDIARLIAEQVGQSNANEEMHASCSVYRACKVLGGVALAPLAIRSRMPLHRVDAVLVDALPRSGPVRDRMTIGAAGIQQAKLAFLAAEIYASPRGAR
jgi:hypothetical protein